MYLKSIELYGFKSFADRTKIDFNENITCIVGPNGSGKSNITDAIRWVLGEQSTLALRGSKMSDVIFAGTDHRRALGVAEVIITFDNGSRTLDLDYNTVEVKRRLYKNGDSEYYINNNQCRLKDVRELFMDTGIGRDGYSVIGQGRIDAILNSRPSERRSIFEEAAGISKFKFQKQDTERKLAKTRENLLRLQDLLLEIENQKESLKIEAEKAQKYNDLYYKILQADINNFVIELGDLEAAIEELKARKIDQVTYKEKIQKDLETLKEAYENDRNQAEEIENRINTLQLENIENVRLEKDLDNQISLAKERKATKERENIELASRREIKLKDLENLKAEIESLENDLRAIDEKIQGLEDEEKSLEAIIEEGRQGFSSKSKDLEDLDREIKDLTKKEATNKIRIDTLNNLNLERLENKERIKENFTKSDNDRNILNQSLVDLEKKINSEKISLEEKSKVLSESLAKKNDLSELIQKTHQDYNRLSGQINNQELRLNTLKTMEENYEGYNKSIRDFFRYTKNQKLEIPGLHDTVANLIRVSKEYEKALTTALGGASQNLVVDKYQDAQRIIDLLRQKNLGRITFLPLDTIKPYSRKINVNKDLYIDLASNLVDYDPEYEKVVNFLLANIIVAKDLTYAKKIFASGTTNLRIVTLDGDVLNPGGSVSGGSTSWSGNIFNRKNELDQVQEDLIKNQESLKALMSQGKGLENQFKEINLKTEDLLKDKEAMEKSLSFLERDFIQGKLKLDSSDQNLADINSSLDQIDKLIKVSQEEISSLNKAQEDLGAEIIKLNEEKTKILKDLEDLDQEKTNIVDERNKVSIRLNNIKNEKIFNSKNQKRLVGEKTKVEEDISLVEKTIEENEDILMDLEENLKTWKEELNEISKINGSFDSNFKELNDQRKNQNLKLDQGLKKINENKETILEVDKNLYVIDSNLENTYDKRSYIYDYVAENYKFTLFSFSKEELVVEKILSKSAVKKLKQDLASLGDINLGAIKSYREVKERYDFTKDQYEDLSSSEEKLKKLLKEIEKTMEEKFTKTFEEVNNNFNRIFKYLFEGGSASLILVEEENQVEAGVDIVAQLPGKKKQLLSAMSGGERSLTTVALLFALLETRPAPFCLLDEVDAALDDANIKRFLSYLENLSNIQFAIVTHRKTTMAAADYIYGVTMEESGVSKVISLKFNGGK